MFRFDLFFVVPPLGSRGGLLFLWRSNISVQILGFNSNMISVFVYPDLPRQAFILTMVYGPSRYHDKRFF